MSRPWDDCRFFIINQCRNGMCRFRHFEGAKSAQLCLEWEKGFCQNIGCPYRHAVVKEKGAVPCHYERLPQGCTNPDCQFKHIKPRDLEAIDLQKKLAQFLAEHDMSKQPPPIIPVEKEDQENGKQQKVETPQVVENDRKRKLSKQSSSSEDDLAMMRARILQQQMKNTSNGIVKKVKLSPKPVKVPEKVVEKPPKKPQVVKRRIVSKSHYSEDEASDISLDELTDEEPEDLRKTLNKAKKHTTRVVENDISAKVNKDDEKLLHRKITQKSKSTVVNRGGRIISIRKNKGKLSEPDSSRPSSSEWIERKITVKKSEKQISKSISNRLISNVKKATKDVPTSESEYSDTQSIGENDSPKQKRKPNMTWCSTLPAEETGIRQRLGRQSRDLDDPKKILSTRLDRFANSGIVRQVPTTSSKNPIRSRLGNVSDDAKNPRSGVKSRLGRTSAEINQTKPAKNKGDKDDGKDEIPVKRKKLILIKKKKKVEEVEKGEIVENVEKEEKEFEKEKSPPRVSPPPEPEMKEDSSEDEEEELIEPPEKSSKKERNNSSSRSPSHKPALERRSSRRRNSSVTGEKSGSKVRKTRKDVLDSSNLDDFEKELLDNPDDLYIGGDLSEDDLFDDL